MFHVCPRRCISVTFGAGSQWLILSSGGCLAQREESSLNRRRAPVTGLPDQGSPPTLPQSERMHTQKRERMSGRKRSQHARTCIHRKAVSLTHIKPVYLSHLLSLYLPSRSCTSAHMLRYLFHSSHFPRSARPLLTLGFSDMISVKVLHWWPCSAPSYPAALLFKAALRRGRRGGHCQVSGELNGALSRATQRSGRGNSFFTGGTTSISAAKRGLFH